MKPKPPAGKVLHVELRREAISSFDVYPFSIAAVRQCERIPLDSRVTFLVGNTGSGKSTIIEAIASAWRCSSHIASRATRKQERTAVFALAQSSFSARLRSLLF